MWLSWFPTKLDEINNPLDLKGSPELVELQADAEISKLQDEVEQWPWDYDIMFTNWEIFDNSGNSIEATPIDQEMSETIEQWSELLLDLFDIIWWPLAALFTHQLWGVQGEQYLEKLWSIANPMSIVTTAMNVYAKYSDSYSADLWFDEFLRQYIIGKIFGYEEQLPLAPWETPDSEFSKIGSPYHRVRKTLHYPGYTYIDILQALRIADNSPMDLSQSEVMRKTLQPLVLHDEHLRIIPGMQTITESIELIQSKIMWWDEYLLFKLKRASKVSDSSYLQGVFWELLWWSDSESMQELWSMIDSEVLEQVHLWLKPVFERLGKLQESLESKEHERDIRESQAGMIFWRYEELQWPVPEKDKKQLTRLFSKEWNFSTLKISKVWGVDIKILQDIQTQFEGEWRIWEQVIEKIKKQTLLQAASDRVSRSMLGSVLRRYQYYMFGSQAVWWVKNKMNIAIETERTGFKWFVDSSTPLAIYADIEWTSVFDRSDRQLSEEIKSYKSDAIFAATTVATMWTWALANLAWRWIISWLWYAGRRWANRWVWAMATRRSTLALRAQNFQRVAQWWKALSRSWSVFKNWNRIRAAMAAPELAAIDAWVTWVVFAWLMHPINDVLQDGKLDQLFPTSKEAFRSTAFMVLLKWLWPFFSEKLISQSNWLQQSVSPSLLKFLTKGWGIALETWMLLGTEWVLSVIFDGKLALTNESILHTLAMVLALRWTHSISNQVKVWWVKYKADGSVSSIYLKNQWKTKYEQPTKVQIQKKYKQLVDKYRRAKRTPPTLEEIQRNGSLKRVVWELEIAQKYWVNTKDSALMNHLWEIHQSWPQFNPRANNAKTAKLDALVTQWKITELQKQQMLDNGYLGRSIWSRLSSVTDAASWMKKTKDLPSEKELQARKKSIEWISGEKAANKTSIMESEAKVTTATRELEAINREVGEFTREVARIDAKIRELGNQNERLMGSKDRNADLMIKQNETDIVQHKVDVKKERGALSKSKRLRTKKEKEIRVHEEELAKLKHREIEIQWELESVSSGLEAYKWANGLQKFLQSWKLQKAFLPEWWFWSMRKKRGTEWRKFEACLDMVKRISLPQNSLSIQQHFLRITAHNLMISAVGNDAPVLRYYHLVQEPARYIMDMLIFTITWWAPRPLDVSEKGFLMELWDLINPYRDGNAYNLFQEWFKWLGVPILSDAVAVADEWEKILEWANETRQAAKDWRKDMKSQWNYIWTWEATTTDEEGNDISIDEEVIQTRIWEYYHDDYREWMKAFRPLHHMRWSQSHIKERDSDPATQIQRDNTSTTIPVVESPVWWWDTLPQHKPNLSINPEVEKWTVIHVETPEAAKPKDNERDF